MLILLSVTAAVAAPATAQDRPFVFSISPAVAPTQPELRVDFIGRVGISMFHPDPTIRSTGAIRDLPPTTARLSHAVAVSVF
ncbi:MAG TPA: hypothetical protein VGL62_12365 [Vicinamibacterales bacterium]